MFFYPMMGPQQTQQPPNNNASWKDMAAFARYMDAREETKEKRKKEKDKDKEASGKVLSTSQWFGLLIAIMPIGGLLYVLAILKLTSNIIHASQSIVK